MVIVLVLLSKRVITTPRGDCMPASRGSEVVRPGTPQQTGTAAATGEALPGRQLQKTTMRRHPQIQLPPNTRPCRINYTSLCKHRGISF